MRGNSWLIAGLLILVVAVVGGGEMAVRDITGESSDLSIAEIYQLAASAGFTGADLLIAVAIAMAESGGNPLAHGDTTLGTGTGSFGLWQIYSDAHPEFGPDFTTLYDPATNAAAAYSVYQAAGYSFRPWSTFKSGRFQAFMDQVRTTMEA